MAESVRLKDGRYIDADDIYDFSKKQTQEEINSSLKDKCGDLIVRSVETGAINNRAQPLQITAAEVEGYTFVCWLQPASLGWSGSPYMTNPGSKTSNLFDIHWKATGDGYTCCALYKKN